MQITVTEGYRLSPRQKNLWLSRQGDRNLVARCAVSIEGRLDARALEEAFESVIRRHEILRTTFRNMPGMKIPVQVVEEGEVGFQIARTSAAQPPPLASDVEQLFAGHDRVPFDLEQSPLIRASLVALADPERHLLLISLPSLCADAWSLKNLVREIGEAYADRSRDENADDEVTQYVQFSEWQNELLEDDEEQEGKDFWRRQDFSALNNSTLPFELCATPGTTFTPRTVRLVIEPTLRRTIDAAVRKHDTTPDAFLLACWQTLLWRLLRKSDIVVGQTFHGRSYEELHAALGLFARELPIRCNFEDDDTRFTTILKQCEEATREAFQWQDYFSWPATPTAINSTATANAAAANPSSLSTLTAANAHSHVATPQRFFPFAYEFAQSPTPTTVAGLRFTTRAQQVYTEPFKLKLTSTADSDSLLLELHYDSRLVAQAEAERISRSLEQLVRSAARDGEQRVSALEVMGEAEREQVVVEWNRTREDYGIERCVHEIFEEQAGRTPDAVAVVYEDTQLTFREVNERANRLAHQLRSLGVSPDARVALLLERSAESVVALLAALKAGAAYLPLDAALPAERLAFMLDDAQATVLITEGALADGLASFTGQTLRLDADAGLIARQSTQNPAVSVTAQNVAYVIYTSGSTGRPKGVAVEHRQLVNYVAAIRQRLGIADSSGGDSAVGNAPKSYATVSTLAADLGHTMIFPALCGGATLHVIAQERAASSAEMAAYMTLHQVDCLKIVPSHLQALLSGSSEEAAAVLPRRWLVLGGEASRPALIERIRETGAQCRVMNHYGPTETTVGVLAGEVATGVLAGEVDVETARQVSAGSTTVALGRPLGNVRAYVLDERQRAVGVWMCGELYIGGECVTRGYINAAAATAERFVPDPYAETAGARMYRTGDRVRLLGDGRVEFLGRVDNQVKVRGYRIELGEVEAALRAHDGVKDCVVVAREEADGEKRLVGYYVGAASAQAAKGSEVQASELRAWLREKLPEYMVPGVLVRLERMPLTANGKVDTRSLPSPEEVASQDERVYVAPRTALEEVLAGIWSDILKVERVGVEDNFFELGGHSLLAMRVVSRVRETFQVELPLRILFDATNVEELARAMTAHESKPGQMENIARVLKKIKGMSANDIKAALEAKRTEKSFTV